MVWSSAWKQAGQPLAKTHSRFNKRGWGNIVGGVLNACGEPDFLANADEAATSLDESRREFAELVQVLAEHPKGTWTAAELVQHCLANQLLLSHLGEGSAKSKSTRFGVAAGRYVGDQFELTDGAVAVFHKSDGRKGSVYRIGIESKVPDVERIAERLPDVENNPRSAP